MKSRFRRPLATALRAVPAVCSLALGACALSPRPVPPVVSPPLAWQAPLPTDAHFALMNQWWQQFADPVLLQLIEAAQTASPTVASAASRIAQSRASRIAAGAALLPTLDATASASRGQQDFISGLASTRSIGVQSAWEIDLFGSRQAARDAAQARLESARDGWHDARIAVAAEAATSYTGFRACEAQVEQAADDARSRGETARLTELSRQAGFESPASAALARASAAQANILLTERVAQCDTLIKGLVALTAIDEPLLRERLVPGHAQLPRPVQLEVASVPAQALAQRPDLRAAERDLIAAAADVSQAQAQRYPRIVLAGSVSAGRLESAFGNDSGTLWAIGPLSVSLPLFDGGARRANVDAARARFEEAGALYRGRLRTAVREVEEALVSLRSTADRSVDAQLAADGFEASLKATDARYRGGLASLFELEDARRFAVQARVALIDLQRERSSAWITLYRALGGGWTESDGALASAVPATP